MPANLEAVKQRYGSPFGVLKAIERAAAEGPGALSEDDAQMCRWVGLYPHRHEPDHFMLRTKQPNGFVTPEQLDVLAEITEKEQKGYADITTRQNFQLHWVHVTKAHATIQRLQAAGITTMGACGDIARNIVGCPVAGVDKREWFDASPVALKLHELFLGNEAYANLPRKYKISVSACRIRRTAGASRGSTCASAGDCPRSRSSPSG